MTNDFLQERECEDIIYQSQINDTIREERLENIVEKINNCFLIVGVICSIIVVLTYFIK
jgi:hypothetical protein